MGICESKNEIKKPESLINHINIGSKSNNMIIAEIKIKEEDINKDIRIINSYEEINRVIELKSYTEFQNERELKENCKIEISGNTIPFNYFYKFNNKGNYIIKYLFSKNLTNIKYMFCLCDSLTKIDFSLFNSQSVTNIAGLFAVCKSLKSILKM